MDKNWASLSKEIEEDYNWILIAHLICWPVIAACSVKVCNRQDAFKPEYIILQLVLQWIMQDDHYQGVCYFSVNTPHNPDDYMLHQNYVFPVKRVTGKGYCASLKSRFRVTQGIPFQIYSLASASTLLVGSPGGPVLNTLGRRISCFLTGFGQLEQHLESVPATQLP